MTDYAELAQDLRLLTGHLSNRGKLLSIVNLSANALDHLSAENARLRDALGKIASGTEDEEYPFRAMPRESMSRIARVALGPPLPAKEG